MNSQDGPYLRYISLATSINVNVAEWRYVRAKYLTEGWMGSIDLACIYIYITCCGRIRWHKWELPIQIDALHFALVCRVNRREDHFSRFNRRQIMVHHLWEH